MRLWWLIAAFFLCSALALLNEWAIANNMFWHYVWMDVPMHFLGGIALAVLAVGVLGKRNTAAFIVLLSGAFIAWEVFEYIYGVPRELNYQFDTALDILMDTLGAVIVYVLARFTSWKD